MELLVNLIHAVVYIFIEWSIPLFGLVSACIFFYKTKKYSAVVMIVGFGIFFVTKFCLAFAKNVTIEVPPTDEQIASGILSASVTKMTPFYEMVGSFIVPGLVIGFVGLLLFAFSLDKTPNKSLNKDATNVAPIS